MSEEKQEHRQETKAEQEEQQAQEGDLAATDPSNEEESSVGKPPPEKKRRKDNARSFTVRPSFKPRRFNRFLKIPGRIFKPCPPRSESGTWETPRGEPILGGWGLNAPIPGGWGRRELPPVRESKRKMPAWAFPILPLPGRGGQPHACLMQEAPTTGSLIQGINRHGWSNYPPHYNPRPPSAWITVNRWFKPHEQDKNEDIRPEHVKRASNTMFYAIEEGENFDLEDIRTCPTYGNCPLCWGSGPLSQFCYDCKKDKDNPDLYVLIRQYERDPDYLGYHRYFDAQYLSDIMSGKHHVAAAGVQCVAGTEAHFIWMKLSSIKRICDERSEAMSQSELIQHNKKLTSLALKKLGYVP